MWSCVVDAPGDRGPGSLEASIKIGNVSHPQIYRYNEILVCSMLPYSIDQDHHLSVQIACDRFILNRSISALRSAGSNISSKPTPRHRNRTILHSTTALDTDGLSVQNNFDLFLLTVNDVVSVIFRYIILKDEAGKPLEIRRRVRVTTQSSKNRSLSENFATINPGAESTARASIKTRAFGAYHELARFMANLFNRNRNLFRKNVKENI